MDSMNALKAGMVGAASLNVLHESARHLLPNAPHVDQLAMQAIGKFILKPMGKELSILSLRRWALAGDLISNSLYYAAVVTGFKNRDTKAVWKRAWLWGLGAGAFVVVMPPVVRMQQQPSRNFPVTASLTVAWYLLGSLAAAAVFSKLNKEAHV